MPWKGPKLYIATSRSLSGVCCLGLLLAASLATLTLPRNLILHLSLSYAWTLLAPGEPANKYKYMFILFREMMYVYICLFFRVLYPKLLLYGVQYIVSHPQRYCAGLSFWLSELSHEI